MRYAKNASKPGNDIVCVVFIFSVGILYLLLKQVVRRCLSLTSKQRHHSSSSFVCAIIEHKNKRARERKKYTKKGSKRDIIINDNTSY